MKYPLPFTVTLAILSIGIVGTLTFAFGLAGVLIGLTGQAVIIAYYHREMFGR